MKDFTEQQVVFLLSMPRSGSTLLSLMLGSHPDIMAPPEPWIVLAVAEFYGIGGVRSLPYGRTWAEIAAVEFLLRPERRKRGALSSLFTASELLGGGSREESAKRFLDSAYQAQIDGTGKKLFVDKTPRYYAALNLINEFYSGSRKIVLLRNPLDIFASYKASWGVSREIFRPEGVTEHSRDFIEGLFALDDYRRVEAGKCEVVYYEELSANPNQILHRLCDALGVPFSSDMLSFHQNVGLIEEYRRSPVGDPVVVNKPEPANSRTANAWERRLNVEDVKALVSVLGGEIFETLGYGHVLRRVQALGLQLPSEQDAFQRRENLKRALKARGCEPPYSTWDAFGEPLQVAQQSNADLVRRVEEYERACVSKDNVIRAGVQDLACLRQQLDECEADRAARLTVIDGHQDNLDRLGRLLEEVEADRVDRLTVIQNQQVDLDRLGNELQKVGASAAEKLNVIDKLCASIDALEQRLGACEADRAAGLELIQKQKNDLDRLDRKLIEAEGERLARLSMIESMRSDLDGLTQQLMLCEAENAAHKEMKDAYRVKLARLEQELRRCDAERLEGVNLINSLRDTISDLKTLSGFVRSRLGRTSS